MKLRQGRLWLAAALVLALRPGVVSAVEMDVACPAEATAGSTITAGLHLVNENCSSGFSVRVISSIAGNATQSLGGVGIAGPVVVDPSIEVPAGVVIFPGFCRSTVDLNVSAPPAIPDSLAGTVATFVFISEWDQAQLGRVGIDNTQVAQCMVNVTP